jgi:hypothetical protein
MLTIEVMEIRHSVIDGYESVGRWRIHRFPDARAYAKWMRGMRIVFSCYHVPYTILVRRVNGLDRIQERKM